MFNMSLVDRIINGNIYLVCDISNLRSFTY